VLFALPDEAAMLPEHDVMVTPTVGILPAAGLGSRLTPFSGLKELLPIYVDVDETVGVRPRLLIEHAVAAMAIAGIEVCVIVVSPLKSEILKYLGAGPPGGPRLFYVVQPNPTGLVSAIAMAHGLIGSSGFNACLALPDSLFSPHDAISRVKNDLLAGNADVVLGVFPTDRPRDLGPVAVGKGGAVTKVWDKPARPRRQNTWGVVSWRPSFYNLLAQQATLEHIVTLGETFEAARREGLTVRALEFPGGCYHDLGTPAALTGVLAGLPTCCPRHSLAASATIRIT
jgi:glucose-1-phosphate thymidylyltransferase